VHHLRAELDAGQTELQKVLPATAFPALPAAYSSALASQTKFSLAESDRTVEYTTDLVKRLQSEMQQARQTPSPLDAAIKGDLEAKRGQVGELTALLEQTEASLSREKKTALELAGKLDHWGQEHRLELDMLGEEREGHRAQVQDIPLPLLVR